MSTGETKRENGEYRKADIDKKIKNGRVEKNVE
jgi:hypothetical protein